MSKKKKVVKADFKRNKKVEIKQYAIDYDKIKSVEDIVAVMKRMPVYFYMYPENIGADIKHMLVEVDMEGEFDFYE